MWRRLDRWFQASKAGISKETFYKIWESRGVEPPIDQIPVGIEDLPPIVFDAINIFNSLGDRIVAEVGYIGKDYTALSSIIEFRNVEKSELLLDIILWLDKQCIEDSAAKMQAARDKAKRSSDG